MTKKTSSKKAPAKKASKSKPYVQPAAPGVLSPVTPPLSSEQARKQLRGF